MAISSRDTSRRSLVRHCGFGLMLAAAALAARGARAEGGVAVTEEPWSAAGLAGTLALPKGGPARSLGILIIAGSGPTDRDGNGPGLTPDLYRKLARGLATAGYRVLRYDKRGVGGSRGLATREEDLRFDDFVGDAGTAMAALAARPDVSGVVVLGHSEGALIGTRLARRTPPTGLILLAGPGRSMGAVLRAQFEAAPMPEALRTDALRIITALEAGQAVADVPPLLAAAFRPSVQPYVMSQIAIDPAAALAAVTTPVLLVGAGRDLQVGPEDLGRLAAARPDARVVRLPAANHVFVEAPPDRAGNIARYNAPDAPLDPGLMPALTSFLASLN